MSFSSEVKEELARHNAQTRHCQIAELAAILFHCGKISLYPDYLLLIVQFEKEELYRKYLELLEILFQIKPDKIQEHGETKKVICKNQTNILKILQATHFNQKPVNFDSESNQVIRCSSLHFSEMILKNTCCKRAFLKGSYLSIGSMSDPEKGYHLEFVCVNEDQAKVIQNTIAAFEIEAKVILRKKYYVVYVKEGESIVDLLNIMEAHVSLMNFENLRIVKDMRNSVNRRVNCEAANITKTVTAASKQVEDILYIKQHYGFQKLADNLQEMAQIRLENPDLSLKDLGELLDPPIGKSGVNHRLRKLSELADGLREKENERLEVLDL